LRGVTRLAALLAVLVLGLGLAACGSDDNAAGTSGSSRAATATATATATASKPEVVVPRGAPPKKLEITDIKTGTGPAAKSGDTVSVNYVGVNFKNGRQFDSSWDRGEAFTFPLGGGQVIKGWDEGVAGMKVGARRRLVIPPDLAYGDNAPAEIGKNATLVFVIDLLSIQ
jgi:peptidylprolyl isomerase